jgi:predicted O-linked N-acetylglucosamine transferase (SPINDLY family)
MEALGSIYKSLQLKDWEEARRQCRDLLLQVPEYAPAHHAIGLSFCGEGMYAEAVDHLQRAHAAAGDGTSFVHDLAVAYAMLGRWNDAAAILRPVPTPDSEDLALLMTACLECGDWQGAIEVFAQRFPDRQPDDPSILGEYGRALYMTGDLPGAEAVLVRALALDPGALRARDGLAMVCQKTGRSAEAWEHWEACVRSQPDSGRAHLRLAMALADKGRIAASMAQCAEAIRLGLTPADYSMALYLLLFDENQTGETLLAACRAAFRDTPEGKRRPRLAPRRHRLRLGYVSGEFRLTPAYYFITPFLTGHDRSRVELFLYNTNARQHVRPPSYLQPEDRWHDVSRSSDEAVLKVIEEDDLDVLVDLSGHFPDNRLSVLVARPAGIQASFPNYPSTTGCPGIDYLFSDIWTSPPGSDEEYSERLYRLPCGYLAYGPPAEMPEVEEPPFLRNRTITFGVMQRASKLTPGFWDRVAEILRLVRHSRVLLHNGDPELDDPCSGMSRFFRETLAEREIDPDRLILRGRRPLRAHLELLHEIDIALDSSPYGGQTTTMECLWMGVPVVTLTGRTNVSRVSAGLLQRAGLPEFVTHTDATYVAAAVAAATATDDLVALRSSLRDRCRDAGLTDGVRLAREMERAYSEWIAAL